MRPTNLKDIAELTVTMRQEDKDEIWHLARSSPGDALRAGFLGGEFCRTVLLDGRVVCIYGVGGTKGEVGIPWMLASDLLKEIRKPFLREAKEHLKEMSEGYPLLFNIAWTQNKEHIRWLQWLGFDFHVPEKMGPDGEYFVKFTKVISNV